MRVLSIVLTFEEGVVMGKLLLVLVIAALGYGAYYLMNAATKDAPKVGMDGYAGNLKRAEDRAKDAMHQDNVANAHNAIERFHGEKDRYPTSLQEAVDAGYLEHVPQGVVYDPATGAVSATP
jgi:hypothetical protein